MLTIRLLSRINRKFKLLEDNWWFQSGAKVGKADKDGRNSLMLASIFGRDELMELFLKAVDFDCNKVNVPLLFSLIAFTDFFF